MGKNETQKTIGIRFNNLSVWGPTAEEYAVSDSIAQDGIWCIAEHHKLPHEIPSMRSKMQQRGWRSVISHARPTGRSDAGSSGGTMVASRKHLHLTPFPGSGEGRCRLGSHGMDWSAVQVRAKGVSYMVMSVYLTCHIGGTGENIIKIQEIIKMILAAGLPFMLIGDFNMTPRELAATGMLAKIGAEIVIPSNVTSTCRSGRMLDYVVISTNFRGALVSLTADMKCPWRAHKGLKAEILKAPRAVQAMRWMVPKKLEINPELMHKHMDSNINHMDMDTEWNQQW